MLNIYSPLLESLYMELPHKLRNSKQGLINIKNNDNVFFGIILDI